VIERHANELLRIVGTQHVGPATICRLIEARLLATL